MRAGTHAKGAHAGAYARAHTHARAGIARTHQCKRTFDARAPPPANVRVESGCLFVGLLWALYTQKRFRLIATLLSMAERNEKANAYQALLTLERLSEAEAANEALLRLNAVDAVTRILSNTDCTAATKEVLVKIMRNLFAVKSDSAVQLLRQQPVDWTITLLMNYISKAQHQHAAGAASAEDRLATLACRALMSLLQDEYMLSVVVDRKGLQPLVALMMTPDVAAVSVAISALVLYSKSPALKLTLIHLDLSRRLLLLVFSKTQAIRVGCLAVLQELIVTADGKAQFIAHSGVDTICRYINLSLAHSDRSSAQGGADVAPTVDRALLGSAGPSSRSSSSHMTPSSHRRRTVLQDLGLGCADADSSWTFEEAPSSLEIQSAFSILLDLCSEPFASERMLLAGIVPMLAWLLKSKAPATKAVGAELLSHFVISEPRDLEAAVAYVPQLFEMLNSPVESARLMGARAVAALSLNAHFKHVEPFTTIIGKKPKKGLSAAIPSGPSLKLSLSGRAEPQRRRSISRATFDEPQSQTPHVSIDRHISVGASATAEAVADAGALGPPMQPITAGVQVRPRVD